MMKKNVLLFIAICFLSVMQIKYLCAQKISNDFYQVQASGKTILIKHLESGKTFKMVPRFTVISRPDDPRLAFKMKADRFMKQPIGSVRVPHWSAPAGNEQVADFFRAGTVQHIIASAIEAGNDLLKLSFKEMPGFSLTATISFAKTGQPAVSYQFIAKQEGYYTIGFTGMPEYEARQLTALWQPPVWQEKRFPEVSFLSTEDMCSSLPATMVEANGLTLGLITDPSEIPFRLPYQPKGNIKMGVALRNEKGKAQPMIFAPVLGNLDSKMSAGQVYSFTQLIYAYPGPQAEAFMDAAKNIFGFRDYRENVYANLNKTIENMIDFQLDDVYSRWSADMKGFDYSTDVASSVKNVSGLHPLSVALITDNKGIYQRRALPMIEYLVSREKFLFSVNKEIRRQQPSGKMTGPAIEVAELAALDRFYQGKSPVFAYFADSLRHTSRQLNLTKISKGDDWPNLLALFKMTGNKDYLDNAVKKADEYIARRVTAKQTDFSDSGPVQAAQFWTDYAPLWMELLNLYEVTRQKKYLDAAEQGARLYLQYIWFYPKIPDGNITVNKNGIVDFLCIEAVRDSISRMTAPAQTVPNWQVSQIGLTPEASNTISWNPAIFLAQFAPHYLRLAYYTGNNFYRSVGRSAVVGRYTNYPGYDIDGEFNTVYARPDYPLRFQHEVSYNQFYYNHVWPQVAMLFDYLISDVYVSSKGNINFPGEFAPAYAYLKSNVYGHQPGQFYGEENVRLWMPRQVLKINNEQVNYLTAYGNNKFYIVLLNQSDREQDAAIEISPFLTPVKRSGTNSAAIRLNNGAPVKGQVKDGKIHLKMSPKGIAAVAVEDMPVVTQFQHQVSEASQPGTGSYRIIESPFGKMKSAIISFGELSSFYCWLEAAGEQVKEVTFYYKKGDDKAEVVYTDHKYPFELSVPLEHGEKNIQFYAEAKMANGTTEKSAWVHLDR